jgi:hypothetical protein
MLLICSLLLTTSAFDRSSTVTPYCGVAHRVMDSTQDSIWVGLHGYYIIILDYDSSSSPLMCGISTIWKIVQGPPSSGSLHGSPFSAPIVFLLYLLPLHNYKILSSSSSVPSPSLCILSPSHLSSSLPSFSHVLRLSSCHPPFPLCARNPLAIILHVHNALVTQQHLYPCS